MKSFLVICCCYLQAWWTTVRCLDTPSSSTGVCARCSTMSNSTSGSSPKVNHHMLTACSNFILQVIAHHSQSEFRIFCHFRSFEMWWDLTAVFVRCHQSSPFKPAGVTAALRQNSTDLNYFCQLCVCSHIGFIIKSVNIRPNHLHCSSTVQLAPLCLK